MTFHVGQQVVCINDKWESYSNTEYQINAYPVLRSIYTIKRIHDDMIGETNWLGHIVRNTLLTLEEIYFTNNKKWEPSFRSDHFRPVKETSIELFQKMVNKPPQDNIKVVKELT